ncbi:MAG: trigger factor [Flavobacteriales bacterium]|nr:trigger factor [Flavobacteriales bacterium]MCL4283167.1 trigger factor [Flavobacteriales bacterium]
MNIERQETGALTATLKLKLEPADYLPSVDKELKEQRRKAALPGFRPGQVPMAIIRKRVGKSVLVNEVERLIDSNLRGYIEENKLRLLGQPLPGSGEDTNNWDEPGELNFSYDVGFAPAVEVEMDPKLGVELPLVNVDDAMVDQEVEAMRRRHGKLVDADIAGAKDMVIGDLIELEEDGTIKAGGLMNRTTVTVEDLKDEETRNLFIGRAAGDSVTVDPHRISRDHDDLAKMLNTDHDAVHDLNGNMLFRIAEIKHMEPIEVGAALFERVFGEGAVADEAEFRTKVKEGLEGMFRNDGERIFKREVIKALAAKARLELPDAFLKRWISMTSEQPIEEDRLEGEYPDYAESLRRQLVEDRIVEKYGLEAKGEEIGEFAARHIAGQFAQYGLPAPEEDRLREMAGRMLADRKQVTDMRNTIVERKLITHFKAMLSPKEKRMSMDEFINLARTA